MKEVLHLEFSPQSVAWIGDLQASVRDSQSAKIQEAYLSWSKVGLGELALDIATRIAIVRRVEMRLQRGFEKLKGEIEESGDLDGLLASESVYRPADESVVFELCADVDSLYFEWRSLYELLGRFAKSFGKEILGAKISEAELREVVRNDGIPEDWIDSLAENRKLFFHQKAPWIALEIRSRRPLQCSLIVMKANFAEIGGGGSSVGHSELVATSVALTRAIIAVREWLKREVARVESEESK